MYIYMSACFRYSADLHPAWSRDVHAVGALDLHGGHILPLHLDQHHRVWRHPPRASQILHDLIDLHHHRTSPRSHGDQRHGNIHL